MLFRLTGKLRTLSGGKEDKRKEETRKDMDVWFFLRACRASLLGEVDCWRVKVSTHHLHHLLDIVAEPPEEDADDSLDWDDPALAPAEFRGEDRVDDGRPQELEGIGVCAQCEDADLGVGELGAKEERYGAEGETDGDALEEVCDEEKKGQQGQVCFRLARQTHREPPRVLAPAYLAY